MTNTSSDNNGSVKMKCVLAGVIILVGVFLCWATEIRNTNSISPNYRITTTAGYRLEIIVTTRGVSAVRLETPVSEKTGVRSFIYSSDDQPDYDPKSTYKND